MKYIFRILFRILFLVFYVVYVLMYGVLAVAGIMIDILMVPVLFVITGKWGDNCYIFDASMHLMDYIHSLYKKLQDKGLI